MPEAEMTWPGDTPTVKWSLNTKDVYTFNVNMGKVEFSRQNVLKGSFTRVAVDELISGQHVRVVNGTAWTIPPAADLVFFLQFYQETRDLIIMIHIHRQMHIIYIKS
jgi:hypothetical protein